MQIIVNSLRKIEKKPTKKLLLIMKSEEKLFFFSFLGSENTDTYQVFYNGVSSIFNSSAMKMLNIEKDYKS